MKRLEEPTPAALYARVSSDRQDVDLSVAAQLRALRKYADDKGYIVTREYVDEAESGRVADRPEFQKMLGEARRESAPFREILVWKYSRFTRNREHSVVLKAMLRRRGVRVVSITEHSDDTPYGRLAEGIIESVDQFYSENLAQEVMRGMRESASRGFWVAPSAPFGYRRVYAQDGAKRRVKLDLDSPRDEIVRRIFDMALRGSSTLEIAKALNREGIGSPRGKRWSKTMVHYLLTNQVYAGTLVWGAHAKDGEPPARVEDAFPAIVTKEELFRVADSLRSKAPSKIHPRRTFSPYLFSGLIKCANCGGAVNGHVAKGGRYAYYVCQTLIHQGKGACNTARLNVRRFERMIIGHLQDNILSEKNIRMLARIVNEELDGVISEERKKLETIEGELATVRRRLDRLWNAVETSGLEISDITPRIRQHRERQESLETAADEVRAIISQGTPRLDDVETIMALARDMKSLLAGSDMTEAKSFVRSFVKEIVVGSGKATIRYTIPMLHGSRVECTDTEEIALRCAVLSTVRSGGPAWTRTRDLSLIRTAL